MVEKLKRLYKKARDKRHLRQKDEHITVLSENLMKYLSDLITHCGHGKEIAKSPQKFPQFSKVRTKRIFLNWQQTVVTATLLI